MRKLFWGAAALALAGCGGGGSGSPTSAYFGLYTGTSDVFDAGNATGTPNVDDAAAAGIVNRSGTFTFNVQRVSASGAQPNKITGRIGSSGAISSATLTFIDGDGVTGATLTKSGSGSTTVVGTTTTITLTFPQSASEANPLRYVLTLTPSAT